MIKKIKQSSLDRQYLASRAYIATPINIDFKSVLVKKPWGSEYLMYSTPETEIWNLYIKHPRSTSTHCHPNKKTSLLVLEGRALFSTLNESWELLPMDTMVMDEGVFHSTYCLSKGGLHLLEFETPPMKHDLLRLEDKYGRVEKGYDKDSVIPDLTRHRFFESFSAKDLHSKEMRIIKVKSKKDLLSKKVSRLALAAVISGSIRNGDNEVLYPPSSIITIDELKELDCVYDNVHLMIICPK